MLISVSLPRLPAALTSIVLMLQPVTTVMLGAVLLDESPSAVQLSGVAIVLAAVAFATLGARSREPACQNPRDGALPASGLVHQERVQPRGGGADPDGRERGGLARAGGAGAQERRAAPHAGEPDDVRGRALPGGAARAHAVGAQFAGSAVRTAAGGAARGGVLGRGAARRGEGPAAPRLSEEVEVGGRAVLRRGRSRTRRRRTCSASRPTTRSSRSAESRNSRPHGGFWSPTRHDRRPPDLRSLRDPRGPGRHDGRGHHRRPAQPAEPGLGAAAGPATPPAAGALPGLGRRDGRIRLPRPADGERRLPRDQPGLRPGRLAGASGVRGGAGHELPRLRARLPGRALLRDGRRGTTTRASRSTGRTR